MVITTRELKKRQLEFNKKDLARLEKLIDNALKSEYEYSPLYIQVQYPDLNVFEELKRRYKAAGWNLKVEDDQREGTYIVISERRRP